MVVVNAVWVKAIDGTERAQGKAEGKIAHLAPESDAAADKSYKDTLERLAEGLKNFVR